MLRSSEEATVCIPPLNISCRALSDTFHSIFLTAGMYCFIVLTVMLNLLVVISISHFRQKKKKKSLHYYLFPVLKVENSNNIS